MMICVSPPTFSKILLNRTTEAMIVGWVASSVL